MKLNQSRKENPSQGPPRIGRTIINDIRRGGFKRTFRQDLKDIYHFYLDYETKQRLSRMGKVKKWFLLVVWLVKSLILKLSPLRRIMLVISLILIFIGRSEINANGGGIAFNNLLQIGFVFLLIILMLELKDKLLAQDELAVGRTVQQAFIPHRHPTLAGWNIWLYTQPANDVGGDLVDYLQISGNKLHIALADVAGKGLGAALMMAKLQATLRALAPNFASLGELGAQVNKILCRDGLPSRFASLVYLELQSDSAIIRYLNAGHIPPLFIRNNKTRELSKGAPALGLNPNSLYHEQQLSLDQNDVLIIYSDGITEAHDVKGHFFGESRLFKLVQELSNLPVDQIGRQILTRVKNFVGDARRHDDVSLIVIKKAK